MGLQNNGEPWGCYSQTYQEDALLKMGLPLKSNQTRENY
jgi:hypothetical protein